jgi:hypothetical protein
MFPPIKYYKLNGKEVEECTMEESALFHSGRDRILAQDELPGNIFVSTLMLMIDMNLEYPRITKPMVFETMVFSNHSENNIGDEEETHRYHTYDEAMKGHEEMLEKYSLKLLPAPEEANK